MTAVRKTGFLQTGGGSSDLRQCLLSGHTSDLPFYGPPLLLTSFDKWHATHDFDFSQKSTPVLSAMRKCMTNLNCIQIHAGSSSWSHSQGTWDTSRPLGFASRLAHCFRQHWRMERANSWLYSQQRDAQLAHGQGLTPTTVHIATKVNVPVRIIFFGHAHIGHIIVILLVLKIKIHSWPAWAATKVVSTIH